MTLLSTHSHRRSVMRITLFLALFFIVGTVSFSQDAKKAKENGAVVSIQSSKVDSLVTAFQSEAQQLQKRLEEIATARKQIEDRLVYLTGVLDALTAIKSDSTLRTNK